MSIHILNYLEKKLSIEKYEISFSTVDQLSVASISLKAITGSKGIHLCIQSDEEKIVKQVQFKCRDNETLKLNIQTDVNNEQITITSTSKQAIQLPNDSFYLAEDNAFQVAKNEQLDILFIIDATMLSSSLSEYNQADENTHFLLDNKKLNKTLGDKLNTFIAALNADTKDIQYSILSFADNLITGVSAPDLKAQYVLDPSKSVDCFFYTWQEDQVIEHLSQIVSSSGGDYIDELAEALHIAAIDYNWRSDARKLVFIIGDSPGFSLLKPAPVIGGIQTNAAIRHYDIDSEAMHLHKRGIEIMSLHIADKKLQHSAKGLDILRFYTQQQYQELASSEKYSNLWESWNPEKSAELFQETDYLLGRGYCYPICIEK